MYVCVRVYVYIYMCVCVCVCVYKWGDQKIPGIVIKII